MKKYNKRFMTLKKKSLNYNKTNSNINNKKYSIDIINKEIKKDNNEQKDKDKKIIKE